MEKRIFSGTLKTKDLQTSFWADSYSVIFSIRYTQKGRSHLLLHSFPYLSYFQCIWDATQLMERIQEYFDSTEMSLEVNEEYADTKQIHYSKHILNYVSITLNAAYIQAIERRQDLGRIIPRAVVPKHGRINTTEYRRKLDNRKSNLPKTLYRNTLVGCWSRFSLTLLNPPA